MRLGVGVRFPASDRVELVAKVVLRSRAGAAAASKVALTGKATARQTWRPGLGSVPIITTTSFNVGTNPGFNAAIGQVVATNNPTSFAITSGNPSGFFSIASNGTLRTGGSAAPPDNSYSLTITASNSFGTSPAKIITVTVGAAPVVSDQVMNLQLPAVNGSSVGNVSVSNGTATSFSITAGNSAGYFAIDNSGAITVTSVGATGLSAQTYALTVQATNALGSSTGSVSVVASSSAQLPADFRSVASTTYASRTNTTVNTPAGTANGDVLVAGIVTVASTSAPTPTAPAGWTAIDTPTSVTDVSGINGKLAAFWKRATNEGSSYTFTHASASSQAFVAAYSGCIENGSPIDVSSSSIFSGSNGTTTTATGVTTTVANDRLLFIEHNWDILAVTPPTGMTERFEGLLYLADTLASSAGPTGNKTTSANGNSDTRVPWAARLVALKSKSTSAPPLSPPAVTDASFNLSLPAASGFNVGVASVTGGVPTSFSITAGNTAGYFAIDNAGNITVTAAGSSGLTAQTYNLTVQATNAAGSGTGTASVVASTAGSGSFSDSDWPSALNRPGYNAATNTLTWVGPAGGGLNNGNPVQQSRVLTNRTTELVTTSNGQIIEGLNISARIVFRHSNVIIRQCRITNPDFYSIWGDTDGPTNVVVEDCLLDGGNRIKTSGVAPEAGGNGMIVRRNNILGYENGLINVTNGMQIRDNWIHDLANSGDAHTDGIQGVGGFTSLLIDHNAIDAVDTSCIIMQNESAGYSGLVVNNNKLTGTVGACIYMRGDKGPGVIGSCTVTNNRMHNFGGGYFSVQTVAGPITWSGNVDDITGATISGP